jgi:hypothetical protein
MSTTTPTAENGIDTRTRGACTGCMIVVPKGDATGLFEVYSANDGHNETYTVDLREGRCSCPDDTHRQPAGGCKHARRVRLALGIIHPPAGIEIDSVLARSRAKYGADRDSTAPTAPSSGSTTATVATDGGQLLAAPDDEEKAETTTTDNGSEMAHSAHGVHSIVLDAFVHDPVLNFDVFGEVIACSSASVAHAITGTMEESA